MTGGKLVVEGKLRLWEQEGGFAEDAIAILRPGSIPDEGLAGLIREEFPEGVDSHRGLCDVGYVRITIERIEEGAL